MMSTSILVSQASFDLPSAVNFDPYAPRINLDSKKVKSSQAFAVFLKEHLAEIFKQPTESRMLRLKPNEYAGRCLVEYFTDGNLLV